MATQRQITVYAYHKTVCQQIGFGQATLKHKALQGSVSTPSSTGNTVYSGPGPATADPATTNTQVWAIWEELSRAAGGDGTYEFGREGVGRLRGQFPCIDDNQNLVKVEHDDWLAVNSTDETGTAITVNFRIQNPVTSPDFGYWSFGLVRQR